MTILPEGCPFVAKSIIVPHRDEAFIQLVAWNGLNLWRLILFGITAFWLPEQRLYGGGPEE
jgi:hypothetical protein